jgi:hypothetical protein
MAKKTNPTPDATTVNNGTEIVSSDSAINAADVATPENTPIPGGGRWAWDYLHACWVDTDAPADTALPTLE